MDAANSDEKSITVKKSENFSEWYTQVITKSEFVDYSSVSGMIVFRPDAYFAWEAIKRAVDERLRADGVQNVYFPMLIPEKLLDREKEHIEGFSAEVAWVTQGGKSQLEERLAIRPTSEAIMYESYSKWVRSWRDLPIRQNQWNSVIRWEFKHPTPLLRNREFLWNEGHSVFATEEEAIAERDRILGIYSEVLRDYLAIPGIVGRKTDTEKFAGGQASYSIEHLMPDGKAIQGPDHHQDGQNFARAFDIKFLNRNEEYSYPFQNTYAITTRELGVIVLLHGDDKGLVMPPKLSRIQVVIVPIYSRQNREAVLDYCMKVRDSLSDKFRIYLDDSDEYSPGWKYNEYELKGVPLRIEIGAREQKGESLTVVRRDTSEKSIIPIANAGNRVSELMDSIHNNLYRRALEYLKSHITKTDDYAELKTIIGGKGGFVQSPWCGSAECEAKIKDETGAKATNMPLDAQGDVQGKKCIYCGKEARHIVNFARSY
ncbi:MAG: proline--tRNA ligase [Thermoplasmataceae archaeon]